MVLVRLEGQDAQHAERVCLLGLQRQHLFINRLGRRVLALLVEG